MDKAGSGSREFNFRANADLALKNRQLRSNLAFATHALAQRRKAIFSDPVCFERLRNQAEAIRRNALSKLPELLEQLENKCTKNGIQVHWAETIEDANRIILDIARSHKATRVVKGKSMVSEEMHLNAFLAHHGVESLETDLGEFIVQLAGETPSHILVPAIHKNRKQIGDLFHKKIPDTPYTEVLEELNTIARKTLRRRFFEGEIGLSGVNMAIAETGTLVLIENEGNGRMCTTVPPVHIAVMGIEKVLEKLEHVVPILGLLPGSAAGQVITTYINMISGPRKPGEKDGPKEVHLVLLDNGRTKILADPELRQILQCIRCGTCLNHCPVYVRIGGHAYGFVYPGPIGKILTPQMEGLERTKGIPEASTLCRACEEVCPVKIPIPDLIRRLRNESYDEKGSVKGHGYKHNLVESYVWKGWALANRYPLLNGLGIRAAGMLGPVISATEPMKAWMSVRSRPQFAKKSLHELVKNQGVENE
jgi:L-lactate dehydrogenase complex protein LldF